MQDTYDIILDLSWKEYLGLVLYTMYTTKMIRVVFVFVICIGLLDGILGILVPGKNGVDLAASILPVIVAPLVNFLFFFSCALLASFYISKFKPQLIRGISYRFTHWGMERTGTTAQANIPWRNFTRLKETRHFLLLYVFETKVETFEIIPKKAFSTPAAIDEFKQFIGQNIPG